MRACAIGHVSAVKHLIDEGADVNERGPRGSTPLMFAVSGGHRDIVEMLLAQNELDLSAREQGGWTAIDHAEADRDFRLARILRENVERRRRAH